MGKRTIYCHTLNGQPAYFDGERIVFVGKYRPAQAPAESLAQIRREQQADIRYDRVRGVEQAGWQRNYVRYRV